MKKLANRIDLFYRGHLILDSLPVTEIFSQKIRGFRTFMLGYPLGVRKQKATGFLAEVPKPLINNHLSLTVKYHKPSDFATAEKGYGIVGFHVVCPPPPSLVNLNLVKLPCAVIVGALRPQPPKPKPVLSIYSTLYI